MKEIILDGGSGTKLYSSLSPGFEGSIAWNDLEINIKWPH